MSLTIPQPRERQPRPRSLDTADPTLSIPDTERATSLTQLAGVDSVAPTGPDRWAGGPVPSALAGARARLRRTALVVARLLWTTGRLTALGLARLVGWFAADPRRGWVALTGVLCAAAVGAALGLTVGVLVAQVCHALLDLVVTDLG